jgi:hypothetical protein
VSGANAEGCINRTRWLVRFSAAAVAVLVWGASALACPVCESETGQKVRAGIFSEDFESNVVLTLLPFPVLAGLVALIYYGFPNPKAWPEPARGGDESQEL